LTFGIFTWRHWQPLSEYEFYPSFFITWWRKKVLEKGFSNHRF
jgi:hypothetical protein